MEGRSCHIFTRTQNVYPNFQVPGYRLLTQVSDQKGFKTKVNYNQENGNKIRNKLSPLLCRNTHKILQHSNAISSNVSHFYTQYFLRYMNFFTNASKYEKCLKIFIYNSVHPSLKKSVFITTADHYVPLRVIIDTYSAYHTQSKIYTTRRY